MSTTNSCLAQTHTHTRADTQRQLHVKNLTAFLAGHKGERLQTAAWHANAGGNVLDIFHLFIYTGDQGEDAAALLHKN